VADTAPVPPQNLEAEESVLGAMLMSRAAIEAVEPILNGGGDFYRGSHRVIYLACQRVHSRGEPVDAITIVEELERTGELEQIGGRGKIHELANLVPAAGNAPHYARIVAEAALLRGLVRAGQEIARLGQERPGDAQALIEQATDIVTALRMGATLDEERVLPPILSAAELCARPDPADLDCVLGPLLLRGSRTIVGADTGQGKTTLNLAMIAAVVNRTGFLRWRGTGGSALIIDLEQGERTAKRRLREAGLEGSDNVDIWLVPDGISLESNRQQRLIIERALQGSGYDVVLLDPHYKAHSGDPNDERDTKAVMAHLDRWRAEHGFALILPTHARKPPAQGRPRLTIHDIASGSGAVVRGAEVVLGMEITQPGLTRLYFFKHRDGADDLPGDGNGGEYWTLSFSRAKGYGVIDAGAGPRKGAPEDIAAYVRRTGGRVKPKDIMTEFEISEATLRERRDALGALGIEYHRDGPSSTYVAGEGLLVEETEHQPEAEAPSPPGAYDEPWATDDEP